MLSSVGPKAWPLLKKVLQEEPAWLNAPTSEQTGLLDQAEQAARILLQIAPDEGFCLSVAGRIFVELGRRSEGLRLFKTLLQKEPNNPGIHEALRRQGLLEGIWCLDPNEVLSPGQREEIDRVHRSYPQLNDDESVAKHRDEWLRG